MRVNNHLVGHRLAMDILLNNCSVLRAGTVITYNMLVDLYASDIEHVPVVHGSTPVHEQEKYSVTIVFKNGKQIVSDKYNTLAEVVHEAQQLINYAFQAHQMRVAGIELFAHKRYSVEVIPNPTAFINIHFKKEFKAV